MANLYNASGNLISLPTGEATSTPPASISTFKKIGVVGDSFASGTVNVNNSQPSYPALSWPQNLARLSGVKVVNFTVAGLSTRTWLTNAGGLAKLLAAEALGLYILALGINDDNLGASYIGTIADIKSDYTQNADTFYGNYGKIIAQIQNHAPKAKLVMTTLARIEPLKTQLDTAIKAIASHFGIPCVTLEDDSFFTTGNFPMSSGHPSVVDYGGMAKAMIRSIEECMVANASYFIDYADTSEDNVDDENGGTSGGLASGQLTLTSLLQTQKTRSLCLGIGLSDHGMKKVATGYQFGANYKHYSSATPGLRSNKYPGNSDGSSAGTAISQSDICVVGDEVWHFSAASDDTLTYGTCWRYKYDPVNNELLEEPKFFWHNWGHVNSVNYNPDNDCLIMGNGSADYNLGNKIYIIPNASAIKDMGNGAIVSLDDYGFVIDVSNNDAFGVKLNVFWTNTKGNPCPYKGYEYPPNQAYAYSDDGNKFHLIVFGFDTFQYPMGTYVEPTGNHRWNGTYNILKTYQIGDVNEIIGSTGSYVHCGQGGCAIAGTAYIGRGHSDFWISEIIPNGDKFTESEKRVINHDQTTGLPSNSKMLGIEMTTGYMIAAQYGVINFIPR